MVCYYEVWCWSSGVWHNTPVFILMRCSGGMARHTCIYIEEMLRRRDAWVGIVTVGRYIVRIRGCRIGGDKGLQDCEDCRIVGLQDCGIVGL